MINTERIAEALRLAYDFISGSRDKTLLIRAHRAVEQALIDLEDEQAAQAVPADDSGSEFVSISEAGSTHTRTAREWLELARADLFAARPAPKAQEGSREEALSIAKAVGLIDWISADGKYFHFACEPEESSEKLVAFAAACRAAAAPEAPTPAALQDDWQHLKLYGYAPGNYMSRCHECGATPVMDKRAVTCKPCAETLFSRAQAAGQELPSLPRISHPEPHTMQFTSIEQRYIQRFAEDYARAALAQRQPLTKAAADVLAERQRQISAEGWTPEHDDEHANGELAEAAACYASPTLFTLVGLRAWPWAPEWWKPEGDRRNRVKAAALLLAEIERLDRAGATTGEQRR